MCFPSFDFVKIHPFVALLDDWGVSPSAEGDQRSARWIGGSFLKKAAQKLSIRQSVADHFLKKAAQKLSIRQSVALLFAFRSQ